MRYGSIHMLGIVPLAVRSSVWMGMMRLCCTSQIMPTRTVFLTIDLRPLSKQDESYSNTFVFMLTRTLNCPLVSGKKRRSPYHRGTRQAARTAHWPRPLRHARKVTNVTSRLISCFDACAPRGRRARKRKLFLENHTPIDGALVQALLCSC